LNYLEDCWVAWRANRCEIQQALYLFSYLIKTGLAWSLEKDMQIVARDFIVNGWIDQKGNILIDAESAEKMADELTH